MLKVLNDSALKKRFADDGVEVAPSAAPAAFDVFIRAEMAKWAKVIKDANIRMD